MNRRLYVPRRLFAVAVFMLAAVFAGKAAFVCAQEATASSALEDELFAGDEELIVDAADAKSGAAASGSTMKFQADLQNAALSFEMQKLRIGGALDSSLRLSNLWNAPYTLKPDSTFTTNLNANLFFDARPVDNLKLYGKFTFGFPFEKTLTGETEGVIGGQKIHAFLEVPGAINISIRELYTDFSLKDIAFFRFGKHAVKWGTGYFYSPADVINVSRIDPQDPEADKEGPVSLRTHIVIPGTLHNIWLYLLPPLKGEGFKTEYTAFAAKAEFLIGNWEWGIGGRYKYKDVPKLVTTLSGSIAGKVGVFAEGVFAWGSDYTYYKNDRPNSGYEENDKAFFQATAGASYTRQKTHTALALQYFYNGLGYADTAGARAIVKTSFDMVRAGNLTHDAVTAAKKISKMGHIGQHYIACTVSQNKIGTEKVRARLFQQFSVSEYEGYTALTLDWDIQRFIVMNAGPQFRYPLSPASDTKESIGFDISVKLGGGKF